MSKKYNSIKEFEEGKTYQSSDGKSVRINGIDENKVRFVLNESIQDMQSHENFLEMMNGKPYSIFNF